MVEDAAGRYKLGRISMRSSLRISPSILLNATSIEA